MKINTRNQHTDGTNTFYHSVFAKESQKTNKEEDAIKIEDKTDRILDTLWIDGNAKSDVDFAPDTEKETLAESEKLAEALRTNSNQESRDTGAGTFKVSCSIPDDTTGQLAAMLARAETQMDVQQVSSKAMRALNALKMSAVFAEGDDAKKAAQRIRRMEKLINRISKKQQQLNKEEVLELQRRSAQRRKEQSREQKLQRELDTRRTKRRRDERNYANREIAEDNKEASQEMYANMANASSPSSAQIPDLSAVTDLGVAADLSAAEGVGFDVTV